MRLHRMRDVIGWHTRVEWTADGEGVESRILSPKCVYHGKVDGIEASLATVDFCNDMVRECKLSHPTRCNVMQLKMIFTCNVGIVGYPFGTFSESNIIVSMPSIMIYNWRGILYFFVFVERNYTHRFR